MRKAKRIPFSIHENNFIIELVKQFGEDWNEISKKLPGRTPKQIKDRYINYLRDGLKKEPWTKQEEQIILSMYQAIGPRWSRMMCNLPGRSGNDIKNRWYKHITKKTRKKNLNNSSFTQNIKESSNITNNSQFETNNYNQINYHDHNESNIIYQNAQINAPTVFQNTLSIVEPMIKKPDGQEITLQHQIQLNNMQFNNHQNNENIHNLKHNQDFIKLINKVEIESDDNESFGQFSEFDSSIPETDFLFQDMFGDINSENLDFF